MGAGGTGGTGGNNGTKGGYSSVKFGNDSVGAAGGLAGNTTQQSGGSVLGAWADMNFISHKGSCGRARNGQDGGGGGGGAGTNNDGNSSGSTNSSNGLGGGDAYGGQGGNGGTSGNGNQQGKSGQEFGGGGGGGRRGSSTNYAGGDGGNGGVIISTAPDTINIKLNANREGVTWNPVFGTVSGTYNYTRLYDQEVFTNDAMGDENALSLSGYTFLGWFTKPGDNEGVLVSPESFLNGNVVPDDSLAQGDDIIAHGAHTISMTFYAHWRPISCIIETDDFEHCAINSESCDCGVERDETLENFHFSVSQNQPINSCLDNCTAPFTRPGYDYAGCWTQNGTNGWGTQVDFGDNFTGNEDMTVYIKWTPAEMEITLHANAGTDAKFGDGEVDSTVKVTFTNTYSTIDGWEAFGVKRPGYNFDGWWTQSTDGTRVNGTDSYNDPDVTELFAHWSLKNCTITFNANGGNFNGSGSPTTRTSNTVHYGDLYNSVTAPGNNNWNNNFGLSTSGRVFAGWWTDPVDGEQVLGTYQYLEDGDQTLYAHWQYTCTLQLEGGTALCETDNTQRYSFQVSVGQNINEAFGCDLWDVPERPGYEFLGWCRTRNGYNSYSYTYSDTVKTTVWSWTSNQTFYAVWKLNNPTLTITLDAQGGEISRVSPEAYKDTIQYQLPYYWFVINNYGAVNQYGITQQGQNQQFLRNGVTIRRTGYHGGYSQYNHWDNWYTEPNGGGTRVRNNDNLLQDSDHTLYYYWVPNTYTCYVNPNGGTLQTPCLSSLQLNNNNQYYFTLTYDSPVKQGLGDCNLLSESGVKRTGYTLEGLYWDSDFDEEVDLDADWKQTNDATIYLNWEANTYDVILNANGGAFRGGGLDTTIRVDYDAEYGTILNSNDSRSPLREGYTLRGWKDHTSGAVVTAGNKHQIDGIRQLDAQWEKNITATVTPTAAKCYGSNDGIITVNIDSREGANNTYHVTIAKVVDNTTVDAWTIDGTANQMEFVFQGYNDHPVTQGNWLVTIHDDVHGTTFPETAGADGCSYSETVTVGQPEKQLKFLTVNEMDPDCYHLYGRVGMKIEGGTTPYKVVWKADNESGSHEIQLEGTNDTTTFEHFVAEHRTYTITLTDKNGCSADPVTTTAELDPLDDPFTYPTTPIVKNNVCSGSRFTVNPGLSSDVNTRYKWSMPVSENGEDFDGGEALEAQTDVHGTITHTNTNAITVIYTVTPTLGDYCIGDAFTVKVIVNPGSTPVSITSSDVDKICVNGGTVSVTVTNAQANNTLTWERKVGNDWVVVKTDVVPVATTEAPSSVMSYTVSPITECSADSTYHIYYIDNSGCSSEFTKQVQMEIPDWSIGVADYEKSVDCIAEVVNPLNNTTYAQFVPDPSSITVCGKALSVP